MSNGQEAPDLLSQLLELHSSKPDEVKKALLKCGFTHTEHPRDNLGTIKHVYTKGEIVITFG